MLDAEQLLISETLKNPELLETFIGEGIKASSFFRDDCREIWKAIITSPQENGKFDSMLTLQRLPQELFSLGAAYLVEDSTTQNLVALAREVVTGDKARRAALLASAAVRELTARKVGDSIGPIIAKLEADLNSLKISDADVAERRGTEVISEIMEDFDALIKGEAPPRITTGFPKLDKILGGGFNRGEYSILAARTGVGKTTAALWMASSAAIAGHKTLYVTVEMKAKKLLAKAIASHGGLSLSKYHTADWTQEDQDRFHNGANKILLGDNLYFLDNSRRSIERVMSRAKFMKRTGGLDFLVIDYVQQFKTSNRHAKRNEMMLEISAMMQELAKDLDIGVLCLAQLNRDAAKSEFPVAYQIKDSGDFEQDADAVILVHKFLGDDHRPTGNYAMIVEKVRDGRSNVMFHLEGRHDIGRLIEIEGNDIDV
jgi:replicative DNA helicase